MARVKSLVVPQTMARKIKTCQPQIRLPKESSESHDHLIAGKEKCQRVEKHAKKSAGERPGHGDVELLNCLRRFAADARQSAKDKQRDGKDFDLVGLRDNAVGQFMENDGSEEQQCGQEAHGPRLRVGPGGVLRGEIAGDGECDQAKNKNPAEINVNGYAEYADDANPLCLRHLFHRTAKLPRLPVRTCPARFDL